MDAIKTDDYELRISEILYELGECREDERNSKDQMLQVISTAGAIIGACFGISALFPNIDQSQGALETLNHIVLFLTGCVLCTAFPYITFLGISDVLRFHYMRNLEDQLSYLVSERTGQIAMLHWMSMSAPILTKNPLHIKNTRYTFGTYLCYLMAAVAPVAFGLCTILVEFMRIEEPEWYDYIVMMLPTMVIILSFGLFIFISFKARDMFDKSLIIARQQRCQRFSILTKTRVSKSPLKEKFQIMLPVVLYYIYPKRKDFQKLLLIPLGAVVGIFIFNGMLSLKLIVAQLKNILTAVIVIDILIYQSRYQLNDICGREEDQKAGKEDRLPVQALGETRAIILSIILASIKVVLASYICLVGHYRYLLPFMALIGIIAVIYEFARIHRYNRLVFILVGFGYPLRVFSGLWAVWPSEQIICSNWYLLLTLYVAYTAFGCFSAIIPWTHEAVSEKISGKREFTKSYYEPLYAVIKERSNDNHTPLKEKGKIIDLWNFAYMTSICVLSIYAVILFLLCFSPVLAVVETICGFAIISLYRKSATNAWKHTILMVGLIVSKGIVAAFSLRWLPWYICVCTHQLFFMTLYYFLRFSFTPNFHFFNFVSYFVNRKNHRY